MKKTPFQYIIHAGIGFFLGLFTTATIVQIGFLSGYFLAIVIGIILAIIFAFFQIQKIFLVLSSMVIIALLFFAPWLWIDNGEDILESQYFREKDEEIFHKIKEECDCDGSCKQVSWAPFGATIEACSNDFYYISFWGQKFYNDGDE